MEEYDAISGYEAPLVLSPDAAEYERERLEDERSRGKIRRPYHKRDPELPDGRGKWSRAIPKDVRDAIKTQKQVKEIERAERLHDKGIRRRRVIGGGRGVLRNKRENKAKQEKRLAALPLDRRCPGCGKIKIKSREWVVREDVVQCVACYRKATRQR